MYPHNFLKFKESLSYFAILLCFSHSLSALEVTNQTKSDIDCQVLKEGWKIKEVQLNPHDSFSVSRQGTQKNSKFHLQCLYSGVGNWETISEFSWSDMGGKYKIVEGQWNK